MSPSMDERARSELCRLVAEHPDGLDDSVRLRGLLADYCAKFPRERRVLLCAAEDGAHRKLRAGRRPHEGMLGLLATRLQDRYALDRDAAEWAVESWSIAFGVDLRGFASHSPKTRRWVAIEGHGRRWMGLGLAASCCLWLMFERSEPSNVPDEQELPEPSTRPSPTPPPQEPPTTVDPPVSDATFETAATAAPPPPTSTIDPTRLPKRRSGATKRPFAALPSYTSLGTPAARILRLVVDGHSNDRRIREIVVLHLPDVRKCYADAVERHATLAGQITTSAEVNAEGRIVSLSIREPSLDHMELRLCIRRAMRSWGFPRSLVRTGLSLDVTFSFWIA